MFICKWICILFFSSLSLFATTFVNRPLGEVIAETPLIVRGIVGASFVDYGKDSTTNIYTYTELTVTEPLKDSTRPKFQKEKKILLRQPGGEKNGIELSVPGAAYFETGEEVVVLLDEMDKADQSFHVPGFTTGKYKVVYEGDEPFLVNSLGGESVYDPNKQAGTISYNSKISLKDFREIIQKGQKTAAGSRTQFKSSRQKPLIAQKHVHPPLMASKNVQRQPSQAQDQLNPHQELKRVNPIWIPLSFSFIALAGMLLLYFVLNAKKDSD